MPVQADIRLTVLYSAIIFVATVAAVAVGYRSAAAIVANQERRFDLLLRKRLLLDVTPRTATVLTGLGMLLLAAAGMIALGSGLGAIVGAALGLALPAAVLRSLERRRRERLEAQLVAGIQVLASAVRAGLNLVQAFELIAREGPVPLRQEFAHMLGEYEHGLGLEEAMDNASQRIGSTDFQLLFSALQTHRQRGGDLGQTLDRIAESIREIQRLEARAKSLTAQGRATARWLGALPAVVLGILYLLVDPEGVRMLFIDPVGKLILLAIVMLNVIGFLWIRRIVAIDI